MIYITPIKDPVIKNNYETVYSPSEDTYLIIDYFKKIISNEHFDDSHIRNVRRILDVGTGTGIIAIFLTLLSKKYPNFTAEIYASDILEDAIKCAKKNEELNNIHKEIKFILSDLFNEFSSSLKNSFDIMIFNPPYLPSSKIIEEGSHKAIDYSWDGGKKGFELILKFLDTAPEFLKSKKTSKIYIVSSSRVNLEEFEYKIKKMGYLIQNIGKKHYFFEDIILYRLHLC